MANNINDETSNNPIAPQPENLSEEIVSPNDAEITTTNQETENMEVHKHPQHVTHKKKWTEYLLEFFMIFFAVTLGFIAENIREHQVEKKVEKEFIYSLLDDLKADTAAFNDNARFWSIRLKGIDSLRSYIQPGIKSNAIDRMYYWVEQMFDFTDFKYHEATIQQLRNTGNFRLIEKKIIVDSLLTYDASIKSYYFNVETTARGQYLFLRHMQTQLFNSIYFKRFSSVPIDSLPVGSRKLLTGENKPETTFEYFNELYNYKFLGEIQVANDERFRNQATKLIQLVQKEYDLQ